MLSQKQKAEYHYQNYLTLDFTEQFDVITLINKDYPVLSKTDRLTLLKKVFQALKPGGKFIFDVLTPKMRRKENRSWQYCENGGFFCDIPHLLFEAVYQYDDNDLTELYQYVVVTEEDVSCFICPNHYLSKDMLISETQPVGFNMIEFHGDIAGKEYSDIGETICCILSK